MYSGKIWQALNLVR